MKSDRIKTLEKIIDFNRLINKTADFEELLNVILIETEKLFNVAGTSIFLENKQTKNLYFYVATGKKKEILKTVQMGKGEGICGHVYEVGETYVENHPEKSALFSKRVDEKSKFITKNILAVPLKINNDIIGVIELVNKLHGDFDKDDIEFLEAIATQVSITLERARLVKEKIKSERLATIGETVAGLSHYIKNILNGLRGGSYIINKQIKQIDSEKLKVGWKMVQKNIDKISELVMDMLQYSKDRKPQYQPTDINNLIKDVIELVEDKDRKKNIKFRKDLQDNLGKIEVDPKGIFRCLLNIVNNSIDALKDCENACIWLRTNKDDENWISIEIKDNGSGIKKELLEKLFTKFFSTKGSKGTGLGLPITKKIIDEHNGTLVCESKLHKGTKFTIRLPTVQ